MKSAMRFISRTALAAGFLAVLTASGAMAQGVDRYEFLDLKKKTDSLSEEVSRLRGSAGGGALGGRLNAVEDEIRRLTGQIERLEHAQRQMQTTTDQKLLDLEYRIIELEGGDPSILLEEKKDEQQGASPAPSTTSVSQAPAPGGDAPRGGSLGVIRSAAAVSGGERADLDAGANAARAGQTDEAKRLLENFISNYPESALRGDAYYWLGETNFRAGQYQAAAQSFLDSATLSPNSERAPESLLKLGVTLGVLGKTGVACSTLREVRSRYPQAVEVAGEAAREANRLGCG